MAADDLIGAAEEFCLAENPDGLVCTEWPNHDGWHRVELDGRVLDTWPQTNMTTARGE